MPENNVMVTNKKIWAEQYMENIRNSDDPLVKYRGRRAITDIKDMLVTSVEFYADKTAFLEKSKATKKYEPITYKEAFDDVNGLGTALIAGGFKGKKISVCGDNSYKWAVTYLAVVCGVGVIVPLDKELSAGELKQLVQMGEISCVITDKKHLNDFAKMKADGDTTLEAVVSMEALESTAEVLAYKDLVEAGKNMVACGDRSYLDAEIDNDEMSIILFTSGTTGVSKGVMLSHKNIVSNVMSMCSLVHLNEDEIFFSFLPLHHTYECTCGFLTPIYCGLTIAYCEGLKYIVKNLSEVSPTVFLGVPAVFESLYKKIWQGVRKKGKEGTLKKVIRVNRTTKKFKLNIGNLFLKDIHALFGGRLRIAISGGAAINPDVIQGLRDFGLNAFQGYGLTEASPIGALNPDTRPKNASIGRRIPNGDIAIANKGDDGIGEIIIKGDNIMLGYYKRPDLTAEVIKDGWFYTGDLGYIDEEGYVFITGRAKNVIITKNGKNVYPEELENYLSNIPFIAESMVWERESEDGEDTIIVASIRVDSDAMTEKFGDIYMSDEEIVSELWKEVDKINEELPFFKRIKAIVLRKEEFEKNSTKKIKRFAEGNKN